MNQMHEKVKNFYDKQAKANPDSAAILAVTNLIERIYREKEEWDHFKKIIPLRRDMNVLELGCGAGRWCFNIAPYVNYVYGVDISHEVITIANNTKIQKKIFNVSFEENNLLNFSRKEKFDLIYFSGVLLYVDDSDIQAVIHHFSKLLTEKGYFVIRDTCMTKKRLFFEYPYGTDYGPCPVNYRTRDEYCSFFRNVGFIIRYHKVSYNKIYPNTLLNSIIVKNFFKYSPKKTLRILHYLGLFIAVLTPVLDIMKNQFSHEFQIYQRNGKL